MRSYQDIHLLKKLSIYTAILTDVGGLLFLVQTFWALTSRNGVYSMNGVHKRVVSKIV